MWRFSLVLLALLLIPAPALAAPILTLIITGVKTVSGFIGGLGLFGSTVLQLGASLLLSLLAQALTPRPVQKRQLNVPTSRPPKRFLYGRVRIYGTPTWRVKGNVLYGCIILSSRPSAGGTARIFMDKRECLSTDPTGLTERIYDFSGRGAILDNIESFANFGAGVVFNPRVWIGRGDQTAPPNDLINEVPEFYAASDAWKGVTVMWVRMNYGRYGDASRRWRAAPPELEVELDWARVWDPRDEAQDPDDPDTWTFSNNQALCLLDGLRQNPIRQYPLRQIHLPSFIEGANVADEPVELYHASVDAEVWDDPETRLTEPRYTANGLLVWVSGELADQLGPIAQAGGGELVRIGGQVGYAAGAYRAPALTVSDMIESGGVDYEVLKPGRDLPRFVRASYVSPARDWQEAEVERLEVEGATGGVDEDGVLDLSLPFVTSATQAMRIQQIVARQLAQQKLLGITLWPEAVDLTSGTNILADFPAPFTRLNGEWSVTSANPAVWVSDDPETRGEVAIRVPVTLRKIAPSVWAWNPETDEQIVVNETFNPERPPFGPVTNLRVTTGDGVSTPTQARLRVDFDLLEQAEYYRIEIRGSGGEAALRPPGDLDFGLAAETETNFNILLNVDVGEVYDVRVFAVRRLISSIELSEPAIVSGVQARFGLAPAPGFVSNVIAGGPIARNP
jgi:hypothetical protein